MTQCPRDCLTHGLGVDDYADKKSIKLGILVRVDVDYRWSLTMRTPVIGIVTLKSSRKSDKR